MSYDLYSEDGYVGPLASTEGLNELLDYTERVGDGVILDWLRAGKTTAIADLTDAIEAVLTEVKSKSLRSTLSDLRANLRKIKEVAIISDGLAHGDEEEESER